MMVIDRAEKCLKNTRRGISLRHVPVTMKGMHAAGKVGAAIDPRDEFVKGGGEETGNVYGGWRRGNRPSGSADGDVGYCVGGWLAV